MTPGRIKPSSLEDAIREVWWPLVTPPEVVAAVREYLRLDEELLGQGYYLHATGLTAERAHERALVIANSDDPLRKCGAVS